MSDRRTDPSLLELNRGTLVAAAALGAVGGVGSWVSRWRPRPFVGAGQSSMAARILPAHQGSGQG